MKQGKTQVLIYAERILPPQKKRSYLLNSAPAKWIVVRQEVYECSSDRDEGIISHMNKIADDEGQILSVKGMRKDEKGHIVRITLLEPENLYENTKNKTKIENT